METPGLDNEVFRIDLTEFWAKKGDILETSYEKLVILDKPKTHKWYIDVLYYLSFGWYDRRGWYYKVKVIE